MVVRRDLRGGERDGFFTGLLAEGPVGQARAVPGVNRNAASQLREAEGGATVSTVGGAEDGEESGVR